MNLDNLKKLANDLPESVKANALALIERMDAVVEGIGDDGITWRPNLLKLVQPTSDRGSLPKGTAIGDMVLGEEKQNQPLKFIPIRIWDARQYWDPDQTNTRMLCNSPDAKFGYIGRECKGCEFAAWDEVAKKSACSKIKSIIAIKSDFSDIFLANFAKTNYQAGMELEGLMKKASVSPYRRTYGLSSGTSTKVKNVEVYNVGILPKDESITPDEVVPFLKELFDLIASDRKEMLDNFYTVVKAKALTNQTQQAALGNNSAIGEDEHSGETLNLTNQSSQSDVSPLAKKYTV